MATPLSNTHIYYERLQRVESDFYEAYNNGEEALELFVSSFHELLEDVCSATQLDDDTAILANQVATRVGILSEGFHRLQLKAEELTEGAVKECEAIALECSTSRSQYVLQILTTACTDTVIVGLLIRETNNLRLAIAG
jgi:hypothetical protein